MVKAYHSTTPTMRTARMYTYQRGRNLWFCYNLSQLATYFVRRTALTRRLWCVIHTDGGLHRTSSRWREYHDSLDPSKQVVGLIAVTTTTASAAASAVAVAAVAVTAAGAAGVASSVVVAAGAPVAAAAAAVVAGTAGTDAAAGAVERRINRQRKNRGVVVAR